MREARREGILKLQLFETFLSFCVRFCWIILALQRYVFLFFFSALPGSKRSARAARQTGSSRGCGEFLINVTSFAN